MFPEAVFVGVVSALSLHAFYFLLRNREKLEYQKLVVMNEERVVAYRSISELLHQEKIPIARYLAFRLVPVVVVLLIAFGYVDTNRSMTLGAEWILLVSFISTNVLLTFVRGRKLMPFMNIRLTYIGMTLLIALVGSILAVVAQWLDLSVFALDLNDLINNLVAALIAATLVLGYLSFTDMSENPRVRTTDQIELENFIRVHKEIIVRTFGDDLVFIVESYGLDYNLLVSILIYEDLNRPRWVRKLENLTVKVFKIPLTLGIAQVKSCVPLTDRESIKSMAEIVTGLLEEANDFSTVLHKYNGSKRYADQVMKIYEILQSESGQARG